MNQNEIENIYRIIICIMFESINKYIESEKINPKFSMYNSKQSKMFSENEDNSENMNSSYTGSSFKDFDKKELNQ